MNKTIHFLIACVACGLVNTTYAQGVIAEPLSGTAYVNIGLPSSEMKDAVNNSIGGTAVGGGGTIFYNAGGKKKKSPLEIGIDFTYLTFGRDKIEATATTPPYKTSFNFYSISGASKVILSGRSHGVIPFIEGTMGLRIFNTRTKIDKGALDFLLGNNQPEVIFGTNENGKGYSLGIGFFVKRNRLEKIYPFTMRVMCVWSDETRYVKRGSVQVDQNLHVFYETGKTPLSMYLVQVGFSFY